MDRLSAFRVVWVALLLEELATQIIGGAQCVSPADLSDEASLFEDGKATHALRDELVSKSEELEFGFVARGSDVRPDDIVVTSGLGGVYPKGLKIGRIVAISDPGDELLQRATIRPAVDFGRLEQVFVMLRRGPAMELLYSTRAGDGPTPDTPEPPAS